MAFKLATKERSRGRVALVGPSGSGKTFTALRLARGLVGPEGKIAVLDTERGSASKYADQFRFAVEELDSFHPQRFVDSIKEAEIGGFDCLIIDSLSHAWMGKDGALEQVDHAAARSQSKNSFGAWREVTPMHNRLVDAILQSPMHIIVTMRSKTEYVLEKDDNGKNVPRKVGMAPVQRDGLEYEFDVVADMDLDNRMLVTKSRCPMLSKAVIKEPGEDVGQALAGWLNGSTSDDAAAFVQGEADRCRTLDDVSALKRILYAKGGPYFTEPIKAILLATAERVKPATAQAEPVQPAPVAAPTEPAALPTAEPVPA